MTENVELGITPIDQATIEPNETVSVIERDQGHGCDSCAAFSLEHIAKNAQDSQLEL
jgi:hypothetical protein